MENQITIHELLGDDSNPEYEAFVDKFKPKLTTDDCYTPTIVYDAVAKWTAETYGVDKKNFVRPFFPGGDYEKYPYTANDVVVDNPPFSIITQIVRTYCERGIRFLLFAPGITGLCKGVEDRPATILACGSTITYENGADVNTSFITNLETEYIIRSAPELCRVVEDANACAKAIRVKHVPKYKYPPHVVTMAQVNFFGQHDTLYGVLRGQGIRISGMDNQRMEKKACFGGGLLVSDKAAAEKVAAEKAAAEKAGAIEWKLSEREKEIVRRMSEKTNGECQGLDDILIHMGS